ncbi:MAG: alkaline phosphatase [Hyphomonadaceae bacterium]
MTFQRRAALWASVAFALCACATASQPPRAVEAPPQANDAYFEAAAARIGALPESRRARNVIIFIGDGMGVTTVTAARIYAGQSRGVDGESYGLTMDAFPHTALSRTYGADAQISDSAPTATALLSGVKTDAGVLGVTDAVTHGDCASVAGAMSRSLFEIAEAQGLSTGIVSTARITHATPAAAYAHVANRDWENDAVAARTGGGTCADIARQLIEWPAGDGFEVALGGGRANFLPSSAVDPENPQVHGARADGRNLAAEWAARPGHVYVWNTQQLEAAPADARVLGLFSPSHMAYESARARDAGGEPSLAQMTTAAISRLARNASGYVLLVEGGRIDHAHHEGRAGEALSETVAFDDAIRAALEMTSRDDTLIIVTADHSHTLTMSGYARRGAPILGLSTDENGQPALGADGRPYTTLGYANGPGSVFAPSGEAAVRPDLSNTDTQALSFHQPSLTPLDAETHGGEDVALYAWGPGDDAVAGTLEENTVFHIMARALGFSWR